MSIIHIEKRDRWTSIANTALEDARLSFKARGLLTYLLSKPDDWECRISSLVQASQPDGATAIRTALDELTHCGYASFHQPRQYGKFSSGGWTIREKPHTGKPHTGKPHTGKPHTENRTLLITELPKTELPKTEKTPPPLSPSEGEPSTRKRVKPPLLPIPEDLAAQEALRLSIMDAHFESWQHKRYPQAEPLLQWEYFVSQCLSRGYTYANFRQAFMNSFAWERSPAQRPQHPVAPGERQRALAAWAAETEETAHEEG